MKKLILTIGFLFLLCGCNIQKTVIIDAPKNERNTKVEYLPSEKPGEVTIRIYGSKNKERISWFDKIISPASAYEDTVYSGVGDGWVQYSAEENDKWAETHDSNYGTSSIYNWEYALVGSGEFLNTFISRMFLPFDTSILPADAVITSATLTLTPYIIFDYDKDSYNYINIVQTTQLNSNSLTVNDYNDCGATTTPTTLATAINITDMATSTPEVFTLNTAGKNAIKRNGETSTCGTTAGVTCFGLREGHDLENIAVDSISMMYFFTSESLVGQPYLTITYYVPSAVGKLQIRSGTLQVKNGVLQIKD